MTDGDWKSLGEIAEEIIEDLRKRMTGEQE